MASMTAPVRAGGNRHAVEHDEGHTLDINVGETERMLSLIGGGALALWGLSHRSLVGLGLAAVGGGLVCRGVTGFSCAYAALGINTAEKRGERTSIPAEHGVKLEKSITIRRSPADVYAFWRDFENLPRFMPHLESVRWIGQNRFHWVADVRVEAMSKYQSFGNR